jgi:rod shape-determining protein MreC
MALPSIRQRGGVLFGGVVLAHVLLISAQVNSRAGVPVLESVTFGIFSEVQRAAAAAVTGVRQVWTGYLDLRGVQVQNGALEREIDALRFELQSERALAARSRQFRDLLGLRNRLDLSMAAADIIGVGASPDFRTLTIGKGSLDGLRNDMAVLAPEGVVGRLVTPSPRAAKVQLLVDRNAAAGAMVERTRVQGVVLGTGESLLRMDYVVEMGDVRVGDRVVTSGVDGIYPKGFAIGQVETLEGSGGLYTSIAVRPAVDLRSLESVLIVLTPLPGAASDDDR